MKKIMIIETVSTVVELYRHTSIFQFVCNTEKMLSTPLCTDFRSLVNSFSFFVAYPIEDMNMSDFEKIQYDTSNGSFHWISASRNPYGDDFTSFAVLLDSVDTLKTLISFKHHCMPKRASHIRSEPLAMALSLSLGFFDFHLNRASHAVRQFFHSLLDHSLLSKRP